MFHFSRHYLVYQLGMSCFLHPLNVVSVLQTRTHLQNWNCILIHHIMMDFQLFVTEVSQNWSMFLSHYVPSGCMSALPRSCRVSLRPVNVSLSKKLQSNTFIRESSVVIINIYNTHFTWSKQEELEIEVFFCSTIVNCARMPVFSRSRWMPFCPVDVSLPKKLQSNTLTEKWEIERLVTRAYGYEYKYI